jgi:hypothetical protein
MTTEFEENSRKFPKSRGETAVTEQTHPADALAELCVLLEEYAPTWYSEQLHYRVLKAIRLQTEVLVELCALLEDHAPTWYTECQRTRVLEVLQRLGLLEEEASPDESK